jgi:flagellar basal body-associated protein FliL
MPIKKHGVIIETPTEARQAERGPSILLLLVVSVCLAVLALGAIWFLFFRI